LLCIGKNETFRVKIKRDVASAAVIASIISKTKRPAGMSLLKPSCTTANFVLDFNF